MTNKAGITVNLVIKDTKLQKKLEWYEKRQDRLSFCFSFLPASPVNTDIYIVPAEIWNANHLTEHRDGAYYFNLGILMAGQSVDPDKDYQVTLYFAEENLTDDDIKVNLKVNKTTIFYSKSPSEIDGVPLVVGNLPEGYIQPEMFVVDPQGEDMMGIEKIVIEEVP